MTNYLQKVLLPQYSHVNKVYCLLAATVFCALPLCSTEAAAENILKYDGTTNIHGNAKTWAAKNEYDGIDIRVTGVDGGYYTDTTEALVLNNQTLNVKGKGKFVSIINSAQNKQIDNNGGIYAKGGSTVNFTDVDSIYIAAIAGKEGGNDSTVISAKDPVRDLKGYTNIVNISGTTVQLIGSIDVMHSLGSVFFNRNARHTVNAALSGSDSFWYGSAIGETDERTTVNLSLADGATWIFNAGKSTLNAGGIIRNLKLDKGVVLFADAEVWETYRKTVIKGTDYVLANYRDHNERYSQVEIRSLTGPGGIFKMDLDWQSNNGERQYTEKSDFITIGTAEDGSHQIVEFDMGKAHLDEMKNGDKLYFASVESGNTTFSTNADGEVNRADELYRFGLHTQSEEDETDQLTYWFLTKSIGSANENVDFLNNAVLASFSLASDLDRFHERQGEARHEERGSNGLWARYRYSDIGRKHAFDMDKNMIQVGYNKEVSTADSHKIVSLAFDYTRADTDLFGVSGSGSSDRYGLNLYYTVLGESGSYADFNAKIGRLGSDYNLRNDSGQKIGGSLWQTFYGVSAELGWKFELNDFLFIEPQTQLQVIRIEGTRFETESGIKTQIADTNSVIGRVGFRAGSSFSFGSAQRLSTAYIYGDVLREFKGDHVFAARGHSTSVDFSYADKETWYDAGIGANLSLSSNTDLWLNAKYIFGGYFESSRQINAGVRFSF